MSEKIPPSTSTESVGELEYKPPIELWKIDGGIDGLDEKRWLVARFTTRMKAVKYLAERGYTFSDLGRFYHREKSQRHTMNAISYQIREVQPEVPVDPR